MTLTGPAGPLQVEVEFPAGDVAAQPVVAIVCHPLPTEGGTMNNKVVTMAARALREMGVTTVRFNLRSVGASAGSKLELAGEIVVHQRRRGQRLPLPVAHRRRRQLRLPIRKCQHRDVGIIGGRRRLGSRAVVPR